jgi:Mn-dependent DtxR family transcriptional regulator
MQVGETIENYLETIYILLQKNEVVRSIDVVNEMGLSKPSISNMMKQLREKDLVDMDSSGHISLTRTGLAVARTVYERHVLLTEALIRIGVSPKTAREDACKIEHVLSPETFAQIKKHIQKNHPLKKT